MAWEHCVKNTTLWHNLKTGEIDALTETPASFEDYIPQWDAAQELYRVLILQGESPLNAARRVLELSCGKAPQINETDKHDEEEGKA